MNTHEPKQSRSRKTQEKLLQALEDLLKNKFFEQITIREIAKTAGVSPASVYRRFENKEALLPVLYSRFDAQLDCWAKEVWSRESLETLPNLQKRVSHLVREHVQFYMDHRHVIRTLYLYIRLNGDLLFKPYEIKREAVYKDLLAPIWALTKPTGEKGEAERTGRAFILILISSINERCLFGDYNPSALIGLGLEEFSDELAKTLTAYLRA